MASGRPDIIIEEYPAPQDSDEDSDEEMADVTDESDVQPNDDSSDASNESLAHQKRSKVNNDDDARSKGPSHPSAFPADRSSRDNAPLGQITSSSFLAH
jgi:hypothetical protein